MPHNNTYCAYCGRLSQRCACHAPGSDLAQFKARGGRELTAVTRGKPFKRAVPPQIKRRERQTLRANYASWYRQLADEFGGCCANCGAADELVLDHVLPIAKGGRSQLDNLQLLCATCNRIKGKLAIDCRDFTHPG